MLHKCCASSERDTGERVASPVGKVGQEEKEEECRKFCDMLRNSVQGTLRYTEVNVPL